MTNQERLRIIKNALEHGFWDTAVLNIQALTDPDSQIIEMVMGLILKTQNVRGDVLDAADAFLSISSEQ